MSQTAIAEKANLRSAQRATRPTKAEKHPELNESDVAQLGSTSQPDLESRVVMPSVSADEAIKAWQAYQELKARIIDPAQDIQIIRGQEFKKKSYWRKVATFFNLSIETRQEWKEQLGRTMVWHFTVRATAPNGRYVDGVGSCDVYEKATLREGTYQTYNAFKGRWEEAVANSPHNVRSTAYTRAYNRAVSDLIAGGEVSAEEIQMSHEGNYTDFATKHGTVAKQQAIHEKYLHQPAQEVTTDDRQPVQQYQCERCQETIPYNAMMKSKERYDGHTFCFKHQLEYKRYQVQQRQAAQDSERGSAESRRTANAAA